MAHDACARDPPTHSHRKPCLATQSLYSFYQLPHLTTRSGCSKEHRPHIHSSSIIFPPEIPINCRDPAPQPIHRPSSFPRAAFLGRRLSTSSRRACPVARARAPRPPKQSRAKLPSTVSPFPEHSPSARLRGKPKPRGPELSLRADAEERADVPFLLVLQARTSRRRCLRKMWGISR